MTPNHRGAALMVATMAAFTINDAAMKVVGADIPVSQMMFLRGLLVCAFFAIWLVYRGWRLHEVSRFDAVLIGLRSLSEFAAAFLFLSALVVGDIATLTAILQTTPLAVTLAGALVLGEHVGWRRWLAIWVGFAGVVLIVQPTAQGISAPALLALGAVGFITLRDIVTRKLSSKVPSTLVAFCTALGVTVFAGLQTAGQAWAPVSPPQLGLIGLASGLMVVGYLCSVAVMRVGDIAFSAPFRYSGLLWAIVLGIVLFGEWPGSRVLLGAAIVTGAGIFTLYRTHRSPKG